MDDLCLKYIKLDAFEFTWSKLTLNFVNET